MYSMKKVCKMTERSYETLGFYCNEGLILDVQRDKNNYRVFSDLDITLINSLLCLRSCNMSIRDIKRYMELCELGNESVPERSEMLAKQKELLLEQIAEILESIAFIDKKQTFYADVLAGVLPYPELEDLKKHQ